MPVVKTKHNIYKKKTKKKNSYYAIKYISWIPKDEIYMTYPE